MRFEWDLEKARTNAAKHGVVFELASRVWDDSHHHIAADQIIDGEQRWIATGFVRSHTLLVVVFVERGYDVIRIYQRSKSHAYRETKP